MESRISIQVDFDNGNRPVIQLIHGQSDDTRDKLITNFLQLSSGQLTIEYKGEINGLPCYHIAVTDPLISSH